MKMIIVQSLEGKLFWLPENYVKLGLDIEGGIPENIIDLSDKDIVNIWHKTKDRLKATALASNVVPDIVEIRNVFLYELTQLIKNI